MRGRPGTLAGARAAAVLAALAACVGVTDLPRADPLPAGAVAVAPPAVYARWWTQTAACAGIAGDYSAVRWYVVPGVRAVRLADGREAAGYWSEAGNRIVLAGVWERDARIVRHEMLHALLGRRAAGHPPSYFQGRCGGWVTCGAGGCAEEGAPGPAPPATAPVVAASELTLSVDVVPAVVTLATGDSGVTVVVRVTNPRASPVWVALTPPEGCVTTCDVEAAGFGAGIGRPGERGLLEGGIELMSAARFGLAPGASLVRVFDFDLAGYRPGVYAARGSFNAYGPDVDVRPAVETAFRIAP